jgi:NosR/NirI family transcriptional regulator, nitrous oxide reductase regulator
MRIEMGVANPIARYVHWLHTRWPAGVVEKLPVAGADGATNLPGVRIVGDLTGIPLLKFSADTGARAVQAILKEPDFKPGGESLDLAIIGGGVSGISAALEAKKAGLTFKVFEAVQPFSTIVNFPKAKPIYAYPTEMTPAGEMRFKANVKEALLEELETQAAGIETTPVRIEKIERQAGGLLLDGKIRAKRVIVAIGRSGNYRKLGVPGENLDKVYNRLYDPKEYAGKNALVVGGGDSALEAAIALAVSGAHVMLSYRNKEFSRPKPDNIEKIQMLQRDPMADTGVERPTSERVTTAMDAGLSGKHAPGSLRLMMGSKVKEIRQDAVVIDDETLKNDVVFVMIGREAPLDFFRRSKIAIRGEWNVKTWASFILFFAFCVFLYHFKSDHPHELAIQRTFSQHGWFPYNLPPVFDRLSEASQREANLLYTLKDSMAKPSFYYTLAYCTCVVVFGIRRIQRRRTPYVKLQTITLMCIQCLPLFILPEVILPWMGRNGWFSHGGVLQWLADNLFERYDGIGHERAYWRAYGFILAFPLNVYNVFTDHPMWLWLGISFVQTFVIIPLIIWRWGKGAYCGWICSCGALAETLGDKHRTKMPHGPVWNRVNMLGQAALGFALVILALRIGGWILGSGSRMTRAYHALFEGIPFLNYGWSVDILLGGLIGVGMYFWFSGRVWCRFACPLAALMHIYARFSRFRIFPEKSKCISCNVCTSVCHQGIDIMNFANKGLPMQDPECVRCSACVQECPTGTLAFGRLGGDGAAAMDRIPASPVRMREGRK